MTDVNTLLVWRRVHAEEARIHAQFAAGELDERSGPAELVECTDPLSLDYGRMVSRLRSVWIVNEADPNTGRKAGVASQVTPRLAAERTIFGRKSHIALRSNPADVEAITRFKDGEKARYQQRLQDDAKLAGKNAQITLVGALPGGE